MTTADPLVRRLRAAQLKHDDRELQAQIVNVLNDLQAANEHARAALLDDNRGRLEELGRYISDRAVSLMMLAQT
jgi:hypothetical protein